MRDALPLIVPALWCIVAIAPGPYYQTAESGERHTRFLMRTSPLVLISLALSLVL